MSAVEPGQNVRSAALARLAALIPAALVPGAALAMALGGGFYSSAWYPVTLILAGALVAVHVAVRPRPLGRFQIAALSAMTAFCAWSYLSISWAGLAGSALTESNRSATYLLAMAIVLLVADSPQRQRDLGVAFAAASALLAGYIGYRLAFGDALPLFTDGRLYGTIGYPNALAPFLLVGLWPLVATAASHDESPALRSASLAGAALIPPIALLTLSRGGAFFAIVGGVVYLLVSPIRVRSLLALVFVLGPVVAAWGTLRAPGVADRVTASQLHACGRIVLIAAAVAAAAGFAWAMAERSLRPTPALGVLLRRVVLGLGVLLVVVGVAGAIQRDGIHWLDRRWTAFKAGEGSDSRDSANRFLTSGSNRYDFWRVAVIEVRERPLTGYGAGNWSWRYLQLRHSKEEPDSAHGSVWEFAADLGFPGLALYLAVVFLALIGALASLGTPEWTRGAALFAALVTGLGHAQEDWLWELFPIGLLLAGLVGLGLAGYARPRDVPGRHRVRLVAVAAAGAFALVVIVPALLAERWTDAAYATGGARGIALAERAASVNRLSAAPEFARAAVATAARRPAVAVAALREATRREPKNWAAWYGLAQAQRATGNATAARASCLQAQRLKPGLACDG